MKVLLTGATGFIGARVAEVLTEKGHIVTGLSRDPESAASRAAAVRRFYRWDVKDLPPQEALIEADAVVNLAGETVNGRWTGAKKQKILDSRIDATANLVAAMVRGGRPKILINGSAVGYYGDRGDETMTEASSKGEGFLAGVVDQWEREAMKAEAAGIRVAVVRTGIVLGPNGGALKPLLPLFAIGAGGPVGSGKQWWPWVHRDDVANAIDFLISNPVGGIFNLTAPTPVRQKDFASALGKVVHRPSFLPAPAFAIRLLQGGFADEILFSKRAAPSRLQEAGFVFTYPDLEPALRQVLDKGAARANAPAAV